ncbi:hypothetical protein ABW20_dc0102152 [Dactylellina cionopaga]|nr:hypothetical protein ABW20_dc0102152 [Dactylellina cionopaga]
MSSRPRPKATAASTRYASTTSNAQFDLRNPNTLAATSTTDEDYDAETAAILNLDEISGQSRGVKRNAVNLDGYDSDSSNEGFGGGKDESVDKKKKKKENDDEDDDDMFGDGGDDAGEEEADEAGKKAKKSKKDVRFLDIKDIEGQEDQSGEDSGDDAEEIDDEDVDEEIGAGGKKKNAPKMDGFNMKAEMEEGRFDDQGNFVRKAADLDAVHDTWMQGVSKKEMKKAKESQEKRDKEARKRKLEEDELITGDLISDLILCLERGETALEALGRLNTVKKAVKPKKSWQKKKSLEMDVDNANSKGPEDPKETARKEQIEKITTAADRLLSRGFNEIYDDSRESLTRLYRKETSEPWVEPTKGKDEAPEEVKDLADEWEYKWADGPDADQIHGPYGGVEMKAWRDAGYFQDGVVFRRKGEGEDDWTRLPEF